MLAAGRGRDVGGRRDHRSPPIGAAPGLQAGSVAPASADLLPAAAQCGTGPCLTKSCRTAENLPRP
eukprot:scaffold764_cov408-Prasinococcus_capsulatus_cf.AAC.7